MAVPITESRIPGGFDLVNATELGEAVMSDDKNYALISQLTSPIYKKSYNEYFVFTKSVADEFLWSIKLITPNVMSIDPELFEGDHANIVESCVYEESTITDQKFEKNNNKIKYKSHHVGWLQTEVIIMYQGQEKAKLSLYQEVLEYSEPVFSLIHQNIKGVKSKEKGALARNIEISTKFIYNYRKYIIQAIKKEGPINNITIDPDKVPSGLLAACIYYELNNNEFTGGHSNCRFLENEINFAQSKTFMFNQPMGICNISPLALGSNDNPSVEQKVDLLNKIRFPKSSIFNCAFILAKIINDHAEWKNLNMDEIINNKNIVIDMANKYYEKTKLKVESTSFGLEVYKLLASPLVYTFFHSGVVKLQGLITGKNNQPVKNALIRVYCNCKSLKIIKEGLKVYKQAKTTSPKITGVTLKSYDVIPFVKFSNNEEWVKVIIVKDNNKKDEGWIKIKVNNNYLAKVEDVSYLQTFKSDSTGNFDFQLYKNDKGTFENMNPWLAIQLTDIEKYKKYLEIYKNDDRLVKFYCLRIVKEGYYDFDTEWLCPPFGLLKIEMETADTDDNWIKEQEVLKYLQKFKGWKYTSVNIQKNHTKDIGKGNGKNPVSLQSLKVRNHIIKAGSVILTTGSDNNKQTVIIAENGNCTGDCSSGKFNHRKGVFTKSLKWKKKPVTNEAITAKYKIIKLMYFSERYPYKMPNDISCTEEDEPITLPSPPNGYTILDKDQILSTTKYTNCCSLCAGVLLKAWYEKDKELAIDNDGFKYWVNTAGLNFQTRVQTLDDALALEIGECIYAVDGNRVREFNHYDDPTYKTPYKKNGKPAKWTVVQHYNSASASSWASGHMYFIIDYHKQTDKILILDANSPKVKHCNGIQNGPQFQGYAHLDCCWDGGKIVGADWHKKFKNTWKSLKRRKAAIVMVRLKIYDLKLIPPTAKY